MALANSEFKFKPIFQSTHTLPPCHIDAILIVYIFIVKIKCHNASKTLDSLPGTKSTAVISILWSCTEKTLPILTSLHLSCQVSLESLSLSLSLALPLPSKHISNSLYELRGQTDEDIPHLQGHLVTWAEGDCPVYQSQKTQQHPQMESVQSLSL